MKKLKKNELINIEPFNYMWIGSCFDHGVCAAMPHFGIEHKQFLLTKYEFFQKGLQFEPIFSADNEEIYKKFGLQIENAHFKTVADVTDLIDAGIPVLAGIDCYWIKHRIDTYQKTHANHFVLIYGYNKRRKCFYVVDHGYINRSDFYKMELSFKDFLSGNLDFRNYFGQDDSSGKIIRKTENKMRENDFNHLFFSKNAFEESRISMQENMKQIIKAFTMSFDEFKNIGKQMDEYLKKAVKIRNILLFTISEFSIDTMDILLENLIADYMIINSYIGKIIYKNDEVLFDQKKAAITRRLQKIADQENTLHDLFIYEAGHER